MQFLGDAVSSPDCRLLGGGWGVGGGGEGRINSYTGRFCREGQSLLVSVLMKPLSLSFHITNFFLSFDGASVVSQSIQVGVLGKSARASSCCFWSGL